MLKVIIIGGDYSTDYIIKMFTSNNITPIVVNSNKEIAQYLSRRNNLNIHFNPINKLYTYDCIDEDEFDLAIALGRDDIENYIALSLLTTYFKVKKTVCIVSDPDRAELFKDLGFDSVVAGSLVLAQHLMNASGIDSIVKTISLESDKIVFTEIAINSKSSLIDKAIKDIKIPFKASIACIYREEEMIIPTGDTTLKENDKLVFCSSKENQKDIIKFIKKQKE